MKIHNVAIFLLLPFLLSVLPAHGEPGSVYYRLDIGEANPGGSDVHNKVGLFNTNPATGADNRDHLKFEDGPYLGAGIGMSLANGYRIETLLGHRNFKMNEMTFGGSNTNPESVRGQIRSSSLMLNLYRDFDINDWALKPYVGAGVGISRNTSSDYHTHRAGANTRRVIEGETGSESAAWSVSAGASFEAAGLTWDIGCRYIDLGELSSGRMAAVPFNGIYLSRFGLYGQLRVSELTFSVLF